jgi:DNA-binding NarL/FixJ family response regulator
MAGLTAREQEIVRLLGQGQRITDIAKALNIEYDTCRRHVQNIREKTSIPSTFELAVKAAVMGRG